MRMDFRRKLPIPMETKEMFPLTAALEQTVARGTEAVRRAVAGEDARLLCIVGPCSADSEDSVLEYLSRLAGLRERVGERLLLVPRVFTEKPRSSGEGYMGLLHQPDPGALPDLFQGVVATRKLHMRCVAETGFVCADELLYPDNYKYVDDLLGYLTVGARSVEDQQHRLTASAADCPVGMKNPTGGALGPMLQAIHAAQLPHDFLYRGWEGRSFGNPYAHAVLRGYADREGRLHPNCDADTLLRLAEMYATSGLQNPAVVVDCSHANSGKDPLRQPEVLRGVLALRREYPALRKLVRGFMLESYLVDGCQRPGGGVYGQSITDPCLGWEKTERLLLELADAV